MKLYFNPGACSLSPHIVLRELGLDFQLEKVDLKARKTETGADFLKINPKGYVPALQLDNGQVLTEGPAIVQYLADHKPKSGLAPAAGTFERVRLQEWLNFITTELHKQFAPLFNNATSPEVRNAQIETLRQRFEYVNGELEGQAFLTGDTFTVADAYLFVMLAWAKYVQLDLSAYRNLLEYLKRVGARPAVQQALEAEGLGKKAAAA
jgi:glutathione S-transferase